MFEMPQVIYMLCNSRGAIDTIETDIMYIVQSQKF